jgi:LacI family transcriptional regulator
VATKNRRAKKPGSPAVSVRRADVADLAGVSPSAVSIVLNDTPGARIPQSTRTRILNAARTLGYRANAVARALASGRTRTIGIVIHHLDTPFSSYTSGVLGGLWDVMHPAGYRMTVDEGNAEDPLAGLFSEGMVDALAVLAPRPNMMCDEMKDLLRSGLPIVFVGARPSDTPGDYADLDNVKAGREATRLLLAAGHRRILHISGPLAVNSSAADRLAGYKDALAAGGVRYDDSLVVNDSYARITSSQAMHRVLKQGPSVTGVVAASYGMAQSAVEAITAAGLRVPEDISVTSIDTAEPVHADELRITTFRQPLLEIGAAAAALLFDRLKGRGGAPQTRLLSGIFQDGETVAPAKT